MSEPMRILVEDDDKAICQLLNSVLTVEADCCQVAYSQKRRRGSFSALGRTDSELGLVSPHLGHKPDLQNKRQHLRGLEFWLYNCPV